jgi:antitoxin (DNA-binding transcriptional repressor) of toxin-antitoxin stability system
MATIRDLRTRFPKLKELIAREGEVIVTDRGRPAYVLRAYTAQRAEKPERVDYFARLKAHQPRPLSPQASRALDEANRGER